MRGRKRGTSPLKKRYSTAIGSSNVKMVADRHRCAAYHNKHWRQCKEFFCYTCITTLTVGIFKQMYAWPINRART